MNYNKIQIIDYEIHSNKKQQEGLNRLMMKIMRSIKS